MARPQKAPLRPLTTEERTALQRIARAGSERADRVVRAKALLAVDAGARFTAAARAAGIRSGDTVAHWVAGFNATGLAARERGPEGGAAAEYGAAAEAHSAGVPPRLVRGP
jgi:hypothetical protein